MPSTARAQPTSSPPAPEGTVEGPAAVAAPAEGSKAAAAAQTEAAELATALEAPQPEASDAVPVAVTTAAPVPPPPRTVTPPPAAPTGPQRNKRAEPLLITGLSGFAALYLLTAYAGAATIDKARDISRSGDTYDLYGNPSPGRDGKMTRNRGRALLIPVAGPFIAMNFTNSARRKYWQALNGGLQAGTLAMAIIGTHMYGQHRRAKRRAQMTASASPEGAQVGMTMRF